MVVARKIPGVYRDDYGIKGDPILESLEAELKKLTALQENALASNMSTTNYSVVGRQYKINILVKAIEVKNNL